MGIIHRQRGNVLFLPRLSLAGLYITKYGKNGRKTINELFNISCCVGDTSRIVWRQPKRNAVEPKFFFWEKRVDSL